MMESAVIILSIAGFAVTVAIFLGFLAEKWMGAAVLGLLVFIASSLFLGGAFLGYYSGGMTVAWIGLLVGVIFGGILLAWGFASITSVSQSGRFVARIWFAYWALCLLGYLTGGWVGLLTLTFPAVLLFWGGLYYLSTYILPLRDRRNKSARHKAFRTLMTFTLGTNYPYYFVDEDGQPEKRVDGNPFLQAFAGPGFVYTEANYVPVVTSGVYAGRVYEPGLTFTGLYDLAPRIIDLRPQLRAFPVEALTRDGIPIKVTTFVPCCIDPGDETVELGRSFPFQPEAIHALLARELVERKQNQKEGGEKHEWVGGPLNGLVPLIATPIVQDIISHYTIDELCAPYVPARDPRVEIAQEIRSGVGEALEPFGLKLVGGGISNLIPKNHDIVARRLENWRTRWEGQILEQLSEAQTNRMYLTERARADVEAGIVELFRRVTRGMPKLDLALALRFIDTFGDIFAEEGQCPLPNEKLDQRLKHLRGETETKKQFERWFIDAQE